jgi:pyruvate/2-oxoglutarate dehydrogenase complex dihydrolipoamide dehydrogenase (E3) component
MNRGQIPYTVFLNPPLSNVGETEKSLKQKGKDYIVFKQLVSNIPKAQVVGKTKGLFKIIIDSKTNKILGASLYGIESHEVINIISLAMDLNLDYLELKNRIYTHPTISEVFNDMLN